MTTTILVVDDSAMVRMEVARAVEPMGYVVVGAVDGVDALRKIEALPHTSLIVCDVHMPNMNGLELLERLVARGSKIPVVMLTAEGEPESIRRAKSLGARAWIVKPFKADSLAAAIAKLVPIPASDPTAPANSPGLGEPDSSASGN